MKILFNSFVRHHSFIDTFNGREFMSTHRNIAATLVFAVSCLSAVALAQTITRTPLPSDHPLVGIWRFEVPTTQCHEIYQIRVDGTTRVTSASQVAESEFEMDLQPGPKGFYKWVDRITKDNGKPDCMGSIMDVSHVAINYLLLHRDKKRFLMCQKEDIKTCVGPFVRLGSDV